MRSAIALVKQVRSLLQQMHHLSDRVRPTSISVWVAARSVVLSSALITGLGVGMQQFGLLEPFEVSVFDRFVQWQPDAPPDSRLLVVTITEQDLRRYQWPLSDQVLAKLLAQLQVYQPRVIGLDLYRDIPNPPGTATLAKTLQATNLIAIANMAGEVPPPPGIEQERIGFNDFTLDPDGVLRRNLLFVHTAEQAFYSFALRVSLAYLKKDGIFFRHTDQALFLGEKPLVPLEPTSGGYQVADARGYQILVHYHNRRTVSRSVTLSQVLDGEVEPAWVRDKIVLIGTIAPSLKDQVYTPYSASQQDMFQMAGVIIHAQMTSQLLELAFGQTHPFEFWPYGGEILWLWSWTALGGVLVWSLRHPLAFGLVGFLCLLGVGGTGWMLFSQLVWIPVVEPALGLVLGMSVCMAHRLLYTTTHDPATGLFNRGAFMHSLRRSLALDPKTPLTLGVLFLHLDRFQLINQSLGYHIGDRILLRVIARWKAVLPRSACLARVNGDEFAIALKHAQKETLTSLADQLQKVLAEPFLLNQQPVVTAVNIGIALTQEGHLHTPENLLRDAHTAMYRAKALGQARYEVFAAGMLAEDVDRFTLENDLRRGIAAQEFVLYYQPIVCLNTEKVVGFEALVRWQHPTKGFIPPLKFIPLAEESGLIIPLGEWICRTACRQATQWRSQFSAQPLMVSINLSGRQFEQPDLTDRLAHILQETGIEGQVLKLEITESMVMGNVEAAIDLMLRLKALGCKLGMDDFGTGYSSLSYLRRFPIDTLKVDKSFVQKMGESREDYEIVRMIIALGHTLGMDLIAEGVETRNEAEALRSLGCEFGQGYFWAKPLPVAEATALLQAQ